jgi:hypothetical protein
VKVNTKVLTGKLTEFNVDIVKEGYKVTFENTYTELDEIKAYLNNELVSTNTGTITEVVVPTINKSILDKIKIEGLINNSIVSTKEVNYYSPIDYLCDGVEDVNDLLMLSEDILKLETEGLTEETQIIYDSINYYDFNNDGVVDVKDVTYMAMYLDKVISEPTVKQFKVTFLDANGKVFEIQYVDDVPTGVAISEAVRLVKKYDGNDTGSFVNGILGSFARSLEAPKAEAETVAEPVAQSEDAE